MRAVGLFSGIGGFELGLSRSGIETDLLCENWEPAAVTLRRNFDAPVAADVRELRALPPVEVVAAGFPCTDLSQVGRTAGIGGDESRLVCEVFRLVERTPPCWLVLENVPNMLSLHDGAPIRHITAWLEAHRWNWAYRTVDSQHFGVRQRRRRVFLVASQTEDPRSVLFADDAGVPTPHRRHAAFGFYWTEGNRGLGWGEGVTPTLKGGSKIGIASPPGVWRSDAEAGRAICRPSIRAGERLQGFRAGWTAAAGKEGVRWKLVGNAVTVPVAAWIAGRIVDPGEPLDASSSELPVSSRWPWAASCVAGARAVWHVSERPLSVSPRMSLGAVLATYEAIPLSLGSIAGFTRRLKASYLRPRPDFVAALDAHIRVMSIA